MDELALSVEEDLVVKLINRANHFIFCIQDQSLQCPEYTIQMGLNSSSMPHKEVFCMHQLLKDRERLFNVPVLLFKLLEQA